MLEKILKQLVCDADAKAPEPVKVSLEKGLNINLRRYGNEYMLIIWRLWVYPHMREWNIICAMMPFLVPVITPEKGVYGKRFYLRGRVPAPARVEVSEDESKTA